MKPLSLLVLAGNPERREEIVAMLRAAEHRVQAPPDGASLPAMGLPGFDALVLDLGYPGLDFSALWQAIFPGGDAEPDSLDAAERRHVALVLRHTSGNKRKAAHLLGISRSTLLHKVRKYGLADS